MAEYRIIMRLGVCGFPASEHYEANGKLFRTAAEAERAWDDPVTDEMVERAMQYFRNVGVAPPAEFYMRSALIAALGNK